MRGNIEGSLEMTIADQKILDQEFWGYVENWWLMLVGACEGMIAGQKAGDFLPGKTVRIDFAPIVNMRRTVVTTSCRPPAPEWDRKVVAHTPALVEALLTACATFVRVMSRKIDMADMRDRVTHLQTCDAPWRRRPPAR